MNTLSSLLDPSRIRVDAPVKDWKEAIRLAGGLLENDRIIEPAYTQAMIDTVVDKGPYIVIAPGFAFAHARPSAAVHDTAMSWVRLATPVEFGHKRNDPVSLVVALAAVDDSAHTKAMAQLARIIGDKDTYSRLSEAASASEVHRILTSIPGESGTPSSESTARKVEQNAVSSTHDKILTVCGNGLGTSLFLKNTLETVLERWGWARFIQVEATDTISAKGKAKEADCVLTSGEIARALGDVGIPVRVVEDFTDTREIDAALRDLYDV